MEKKTKACLILLILFLLLGSGGCSNRNDPALVVTAYFEQQSQDPADKLAALIIAHSTFQRPAVYEKQQAQAFIQVQMLIPNISLIASNAEDNCAGSESEKYLYIEREFSKLSDQEKMYTRVKEKIRVIKEDGVWIIPAGEQKNFEEKLLTYAQKGSMI